MSIARHPLIMFGTKPAAASGYLLDTYTGAAIAVGTKDLITGASACMRVRRSGDDAENDFTLTEISDGTLTAWVIAGGGTQHGYVVKMTNYGSASYYLQQVTLTTQPSVVIGGVLNTTAYGVFWRLNSPNTTGRLLVTNTSNAVSSINAQYAIATMVITNFVSDQRYFGSVNSNAPYLQISNSSFQEFSQTAVSLPTNTFVTGDSYIISAVYNNGTITLWKNGVSLASGNCSTSRVIGAEGYNFSATSNSRILSFVVYPDLTYAASIADIHAKLNAQHGIY